jgi:hypothetical protein
MTQHRYVFVGGLHRSATTLLGKVLAQHPEVSGLADTGVIEDEGQLLQPVFPTDMAHGGPGRFAFDPAAHLTESSPLATPAHAAQVFAAWKPYWNLDRPVLLEKSPPNLIRSRYLQALFPDSSFIFIIRHPVAASLATHKWSGTGIHSLIHHWLLAHDLLRADLPFLKRAIVITYEALLARPAETLATLGRFLQLAPFEFDVNLRADGNKRYHERWRAEFLRSEQRARPVPTPRNFYGTRSKLRDFSAKRMLKRYLVRRMFGTERQLSLSLFEAQDAVAVFESEVARHGYSLLDPKIEPASPIAF